MTDCQDIMILDGNSPLAFTEAIPEQKLRALIDDYISLKEKHHGMCKAIEEWKSARSGEINWQRLANAEHGLMNAFAHES